MKLLLTILFSLICFIGYSQTPYKTPYTKLGSLNTAVSDTGGLFVRETFVPPSFTDTNAANLTRASLYAGSIIITGNSSYYRSDDATRWILYGTSGSACMGTRLISGSVTWSGVGMGINATDLVYDIICPQYFAAASNFNLTASHPSLNRIDVIYADTSGNIGILTGTPATNPQPQDVNPLSQIFLTYFYVPAGATAPNGTVTMIYNENIEWSGSSDISVINFASTSATCFGTLSTLATGATDGQYIQWQNGSPLVLSDYPFTKLLIKNVNLPVDASRTRFLVSYYLGATQVSSTFSIQNGSYGYDATNTTDCQLIVLPNYLLSYLSTATFDAIKIVVTGAPSPFQLDRIYLLSGAVIPSTPADAWTLRYNSGTNPAINGIGTSDSTDLNIGTNGTPRMTVKASGISQTGDTTIHQLKIASDGTLYWDYTPTILADLPLEIYLDGFQKHIKLNGGAGWALTGNAGTTVGTNFIGTTDNVDLQFKVNNEISGYIGKGTIRNTALGYQALSAHVISGTDNTAIGSGALWFNNLGVGNTAVGSGAQASAANGNYNTGIGMQSLGVAAGNNNSGLGRFSGFSLTSGNNNTAIGYSALDNGTTGSFNLSLGYYSGSNISTGSNNITIGDSAYVGTATSSNQLTIQNIIYGVNNSGTGTTLSTGNIGIGLKVPTARLHLPAGTTAAGTAPLKFTSAALTTTPEIGAMQFQNGLWFLDSSNSIRDTVATRRWARDNITGGGGSIPTTANAVWYGNAAGTGTANANKISFDESNNFFQLGQQDGDSAIFQLNVGTDNGAPFRIYDNIKGGNVFRINTTDKQFLIDENGYGYKVGLGTSSPDSNLTVIGSASVSTNMLVGGNVGIGATPTADQLLVVNDGVTDLLMVDKTNRISTLQASDGTSFSAITVIGNSGGNVLFGLQANNGVNDVDITGDADANTITLTAANTTATGLLNNDLDINLGQLIAAGIGTTGASGLTTVGDWAGIGSGTKIIIDDNNLTITATPLAGTGTRAVLASSTGELSAPVSDFFAKYGIHNYTNGLKAVNATNPVNFFYKPKYEKFGKSEQIGFIAQDIQKILPNSVYYNKDGTMGFNAFDLIPVLWSSVQELSAKVDAQAKEIKKLKRKPIKKKS